MNWKTVLWYGYWIFILGLNSYFAGEHGYIVVIAELTGFWLGAGVRFACLKKSWDNYQLATEKLLETYRTIDKAKTKQIEQMIEQIELLKDGESWKGA